MQVRNTNGNTWSLGGSNVQAAIDDQAVTGGGTVWVEGDTGLLSPLHPRNSVQVDFLSNRVILNADVSFLVVEGHSSEGCVNAHVKNARITPQSQQTAPIIELRIKHDKSGRVRHNTFENLFIGNEGRWIDDYGWQDHAFDGILIINEHGGSSSLANTFQNIQMKGVETGIHLKQVGDTSGWDNGNFFSNIFIDQFVSMIWFDFFPGNSGPNQNLFNHIKGQAAPWSEYGVRDIAGTGNHFDHVLIWDWWSPVGSGTAVNEWLVSGAAHDTYICAHNIEDIVDKGAHTVIEPSWP